MSIANKIDNDLIYCSCGATLTASGAMTVAGLLSAKQNLVKLDQPAVSSQSNNYKIAVKCKGLENTDKVLIEWCCW